MPKLNRRNFITTIGSGVLGLGLSKKVKADKNDTESPPKIKKYNTFGKTGLKVPDVSCGAISLFEPNVLRYAYECGVTYFDTAESYLRTKSESYVGEALKDVRDKVVLTTKHAYPSNQKRIKRENIIKRVENSLKRMQTDYVDVALIHELNDLSLLKNEEIQAAYSQLKKDGKIRFTGFSTHNAKLTLKQALSMSTNFIQVVLVIYNHDQGKTIEPLLEKIHKKGIGITAMKVFAGGKHGNLKSFVTKEVSYPQAAIRWVLNNPNIDNLIVTMSSYSHVEEYAAASNQPLNIADAKVIADYQRRTRDLYCRVGCSECRSSCPKNVSINDVLRYLMYFEDYRMEKEAMRYYSELGVNKKPLSCTGCSGTCVSGCPYGIKVQDSLIHAHEILSV